MAITYVGSTAGLFVRLGKLFFLAKKLDAFQDDVLAEAEDVVDAFGSADLWQIPEIINLATGFKAQLSRRVAVGSADRRQARVSAFAGEGASPSSLSTMYMNSLHGAIGNAAKTLVKEAVRTGLDLQVSSPTQALIELIRDMELLGHYVDANTIGTVSLALKSGMTGNGTVLTSQSMPDWMIGNALSQKWQTTRAEIIELRCVSDESTGTPAGGEVFSITGKSAYHRYSVLWPDGSGANGKIPITSAGQTGTSENLLYNSDFNIWTSATACDKWTFSQTGNNLAHTAGGQGGALSNDTERTTTTYGSRGTYNIQFNGNNSCKHLIQQKLGNNTDGSIGAIRPSTSVVFSMRIKAHTTTITSGVLRAALWNAAASRVSAAASTVDFSSANQDSSYTHFSGVWDLSEKAIPTDLRFGLDFSTALQADRSLQIGELIIAYPTAAYNGGPGFVIVRGTTDFKLTDEFNTTFTNNYASEFQLYFDKYLNTSSAGLNLPIAGTGTNFSDSGYIT